MTDDPAPGIERARQMARRLRIPCEIRISPAALNRLCDREQGFATRVNPVRNEIMGIPFVIVPDDLLPERGWRIIDTEGRDVDG